MVFPDAAVEVVRDGVAERGAPSAGSVRSAATSTKSNRPSSNATDSDSTRADSPLREVDGAIVVDTSDMSIDEVVDRIVEMLA